jgi:hypothetical protein
VPDRGLSGRLAGVVPEQTARIIWRQAEIVLNCGCEERKRPREDVQHLPQFGLRYGYIFGEKQPTSATVSVDDA